MLIKLIPFSTNTSFSYIPTLIILISILSQLHPIHSENQQHQNIKNTFEHLVKIHLSNGTMNNAYLNYTEYLNFLEKISNQFPSLTSLDSVGYSYNNESIPLLIISNKIKPTPSKKSILINGMIHGREPVSMMMNLYIILHILTLPNSLLNTILYETNLYFIPIINVDAYKINCENYISSKTISNSYYRKNRHFDSNTKCYSDMNNGVDLNRNFKVGFAYDNIGSSNHTCNEAYRGPYPFSEPETQAYRDFVENHNDIVISINYHTFGNLIITPYNYLDVKESEEKIQKDSSYSLLLKYYGEFEKEANYPKGFIFGNGMKTIKYTANGDCTDWMFGEKKILSFSPELGNGKEESDNFYPNKNVTFDVIEKNLPSALYTIQKLKYFLKSEQISSYYVICNDFSNMIKDIHKESNLRGSNNEELKCNENEEVLHFEIGISNEGFSDYIYNEYNGISLTLITTIDKINTIIYWYKDNESQLLKYQTIDLSDNSTTPLPEEKYNNTYSNIKIPLDINIPSRSNITLMVEIICEKDTFLKQFKNKENITDNSTQIQESKNMNIVLTLLNLEQISTTYPIFNSNETKLFNWLFNSPSVIYYFENITNYSPILENRKGNQNSFFTSTSIVLCVCVLLIICFLLYIFYLVCKQSSSDHHTLHEEQVTIPQINKESASITPGIS